MYDIEKLSLLLRTHFPKWGAKCRQLIEQLWKLDMTSRDVSVLLFLMPFFGHLNISYNLLVVKRVNYNSGVDEMKRETNATVENCDKITYFSFY